MDQDQLVFERYDDNEQAIVIASRVDYETTISIPEEYKGAKIVFSNGENRKNTLAPYGAIVVKKQ